MNGRGTSLEVRRWEDSTTPKKEVRMKTHERLRQWADARDRRDPNHGKHGTRLLRQAADEIEAEVNANTEKKDT